MTYALATPAHAEELARVMRTADVAELEASHGRAPFPVLLETLGLSEIAFTVFFDGEVAAMWGAGPTTTRTPLTGWAWALTGRAVDRHPKEFLRCCRPALERLLWLYPVLLNVVDARYTAALRWARWLGFEVDKEPIRLPPYNMPFHVIRLARTPWAQ